MMHKIGERICTLRKKRNISQEEMASLLNVSRQTVSKWETGDTLPDVYNAVALANLFHVSLDSLVLGGVSKDSGSSYIATLKEKRRRFNIKAIIVGSCGSLTFLTTIMLMDGFGVSRSTMSIVMVCIFPILAFCWGYAIYHFVKLGRISEEIRFIQQKELVSLTQSQEKT